MLMSEPHISPSDSILDIKEQIKFVQILQKARDQHTLEAK